VILMNEEIKVVDVIAPVSKPPEKSDFLSWLQRKGYRLLYVTSALTWILFFTLLYLKVNYPPKYCCCSCGFNNTNFQCGLETSNNLFVRTAFGFEDCESICSEQGMILLREMNVSQVEDLIRSKSMPDHAWLGNNFSLRAVTGFE